MDRKERYKKKKREKLKEGSLKCKHGTEGFCCSCKYGNYGWMRKEDNPRDLVDDLKTLMGYKMIKARNMGIYKEKED